MSTKQTPAKQTAAKPAAAKVVSATRRKTVIEPTVVAPSEPIIEKPRALRKPAPRVKAAKHRTPAATPEPATETISPSSENAGEIIAALAYSYWEARGRQGGDPFQDWLRAEEEYRSRTTLTATASAR